MKCGRMKSSDVFTWFLVMFVVGVKSSLISTKMDLCGPIMHLVLDHFDESSATIALASNELATVCKLKISAPKSHVIHLNVLEAEYRKDILTNSRSENCHLNVYQGDHNKPVWSGDPCSNEPLSDIDLLNPDVTLEWSPPIDPSRTKGRRLLVTAVGRGDVCKDDLQHTCMSIGHEPLFCVSKYLICDGNNNCPKGATKNDEDDKMCRIAIFMLFKQIKNTDVNDKILNLIMTKSTKPPKTYRDWRDWTIIHKLEVDTTTQAPITTEPTPASHIESLSAALSHYGPWGYILVGMLICGTVLMFCGVWECFKKPKPTPETAPPSPAAVLIINPQEENNPPRYEDIDPPSYATLFPNIKDTNTTQLVAAASPEVNSNLSELTRINTVDENQNDNEISNNATTIVQDNARASVSGISSVVTNSTAVNSDSNHTSIAIN